MDNEFIQALFELCPHGIIITLTDGTVLSANEAACKLLGWTMDELCSSRHDQLAIHDDAFQKGMKALARAGRYVGEITCMRRDGSTFPAAVTAATFGSPIKAFVIFRDITEQKCQEAQLQTLLKAKDDFLAMCSHEMKNPLTVMLGNIGLLMKMIGRMDEAQRDKHLKSLYRNACRLNRLISDLQDYSRLETGHLSMNFVPVDINTFLIEAVEGFIKGCGTHTIVTDLDLQGTYINGDPARLIQVVTNLLSNAVRYSEHGTVVKVSAVFRTDRVCISVQDQGQGISEQDKARLFDRYYRSPLTKSGEGMGLGLYITSEIVKFHEGIITVDSELGKGSTFTVSLPVLRVKHIVSEVG